MKTSFQNKVFNVVNYFFLAILSLLAIIPFYLVIINSFTKESYIMNNGYSLFPKDLTLTAYKWILGGNSTVYNAYKITILITIVGVVFGLILVSMLAYAASRKHLRYRNVLSIIAWIPTVFYAGLIPFYMVLVKMNFQNNFLGLVIPILVNPFNIFLMINYFRGLPDAVMESAKIDGANDFRTFIKIVLPMSKPVIATVALFIILQLWNEWNLALLLIDNSHRELYPLQYLLRQIMAQVSYSQGQNIQMIGANELPQESVKMATVAVTIGPIILIYPYIQKYFVSGITLGAVKG